MNDYYLIDRLGRVVKDSVGDELIAQDAQVFAVPCGTDDLTVKRYLYEGDRDKLDDAMVPVLDTLKWVPEAYVPAARDPKKIMERALELSARSFSVEGGLSREEVAVLRGALDALGW